MKKPWTVFNACVFLLGDFQFTDHGNCEAEEFLDLEKILCRFDCGKGGEEEGNERNKE